MNRLVNELNANDFTDYLHEDWLTPVVRPASRGKEIELWLEEHSEVKDYLILDDNQKMLNHQMSKFVQTSALMGMVQESYYQARNILQSNNQQRFSPELTPEYVEKS